ncbi:hypothetical protein PoB_007393000 [Plakobranchus ocellatus]|uniref:Uncharacterized protein n=1 Tax=Plakobranchus ocellatus TaxID=259542 RepID=A0AAV4DTE9_9GAST|nr:hypothetical protein PoB_007393000 [Plakobranchus ocellatus]
MGTIPSPPWTLPRLSDSLSLLLYVEHVSRKLGVSGTVASESGDLLGPFCRGGVGDTVACESALRSAVTLQSRVRSPPSVPRPFGGSKSLRSPCCGLAIYNSLPPFCREFKPCHAH